MSLPDTCAECGVAFGDHLQSCPVMQQLIEDSTAVCDLCGSADPLHSHSPEEWGFYGEDEMNEERMYAPRCGACEGRGEVEVRPEHPDGPRTRVPCVACQGTGYAGGREP
jgi:hypothetical protein